MHGQLKDNDLGNTAGNKCPWEMCFHQQGNNENTFAAAKSEDKLATIEMRFDLLGNTFKSQRVWK